MNQARKYITTIGAIAGVTLAGAAVAVLVSGASVVSDRPAVANAADAEPSPPAVETASPQGAEPGVAAEATPPAANAERKPYPWEIDPDPEQAVFDALIDECMAQQGYADDLALWREQDFRAPDEETEWYQSNTPDERAAFEYALWGTPDSPGVWEWQDHGCEGYAENELGLQYQR